MSTTPETSVNELAFSVRTSNSLEFNGIRTVGDLSKLTRQQLLKIRGLGKKQLAEIEEKLEQAGWSLMDNYGPSSTNPDYVRDRVLANREKLARIQQTLANWESKAKQLGMDI